MSRYEFSVPEVHYQTYVVEADSPEDARKKWVEGEAEAVDGSMEYSHVGEDYPGPTNDELREVKE